METISEKVLQTVALTRPCLLSILPVTARIKPGPADWSKQEILGHLIDSAMNNIQRFVRGGYNAAENFPPYNQERWVEIQGYNDRDWAETIEMWVVINRHLCAILNRLTDDQLQNPCGIGRETPVTLAFVMEDYLRHLKMHLGQILEQSI
jgi:hypothetical protein